MRTTLNLDDELMLRVKQRAAAQGRTVTSLVEEGLRAVLHAAEPPASSRPITVTTYGGGARPGVDVDDSRRLSELLDEEQDARFRSGAGSAAAPPRD